VAAGAGARQQLAAAERRRRWVELREVPKRPQGWVEELGRRTELERENRGVGQGRVNSMRSERSSCQTKPAQTMCFCTLCTKPQDSEAMLTQVRFWFASKPLSGKAYEGCQLRCRLWRPRIHNNSRLLRRIVATRMRSAKVLMNQAIACARERQVNLLSTQGLREEDEIPRLDADESGSRGFDIRDEQEGYGYKQRKNQ
jgi:hypothetical protein